MDEETYHRCVAYHEAGHAVAFYAFGIPFRRVITVEDAAAHGRTPTYRDATWYCLDADSRPEHVALTEAWATAFCAGAVAEERGTGMRVYDCWELRYVPECYDEALKLPGDPEHNVDCAFAAARDIVDRYWSAVEALAQALAPPRVMGRKEALAIIRNALPKCLDAQAAERRALFARWSRHKQRQRRAKGLQGTSPSA